MAVNDDAFFAFAKQADEEAKKRSSNSGNFAKPQYEDINYVGLEQDVPRIVRIVGGAPILMKAAEDDDKYTARTVTISWIIGDDGNKFRCVRPSFKQDNNHILNRIINKVTEAKWDKQGNKTFPVKENFPAIYDIVDKNGLKPTEPAYKFDRGWKGQEKLVFNCIDRESDINKQTKHTCLIARSVSDSGYADDGLSAYSTLPKFTSLFRTYGSWEKYDVAITRHPDKDNAFEISNISRVPELAPANKQQFIVEGALTAEEEAYEKYDIAKIYRYTSATKLLNRLKGKIANIDAALGTNFLQELQDLSDKEKEEWEANKEEEAPVSAPAPQSAPVQAAPVREAIPARQAAPVRQAYVTKPIWETLPYPDAIPEEYRTKIKSYTVNPATGKAEIEWDVPITDLAGCPECGVPSPLACASCPNCGTQF